jgi:hypothetical protein
MRRLLNSVLMRLRNALQCLSSSQGAFSSQYSNARLNLLNSLIESFIPLVYRRVS